MADCIIEMTGHRASETRLARALAAQYCEMDVRISDRRPRCRVEFSQTELGEVSLYRYRSEGLHHGLRSWTHVRQDARDDYFVQIPLGSRYGIRHCGRETSVAPGSFVLLRSAQPFEIDECEKGDASAYSTMIARVPAALLRARLPHVDQLCNHPLALRPGAARLMLRVIEAVVEEGAGLDAGSAPGVGLTVADAVARAAGSAPLPLAGGDNSSARDDTFARARQFIDARLDDPTLDRQRVAAHCRVSLRHLHDAFAAQDLAVATYIREQRLQQCRAMLQDPALATCSIARIASDWGFVDAAQFAHAYRQRFGCSARDERRRVLPGRALAG